MRTSIRILWLGVASAVLGLCSSVCDAELVVIVSANSPVTALTENQVADLYLGRTRQLPGGGLALPIDLADDAANRANF